MYKHNGRAQRPGPDISVFSLWSLVVIFQIDSNYKT